MPEFYLIPKRLARKAPALSSSAQWVEAAVFRFIFALMRKLSLNLALQLSAFAFGLGSVYSDKASKAHTNLAIAFPDIDVTNVDAKILMIASQCPPPLNIVHRDCVSDSVISVVSTHSICFHGHKSCKYVFEDVHGTLCVTDSNLVMHSTTSECDQMVSRRTPCTPEHST